MLKAHMFFVFGLVLYFVCKYPEIPRACTPIRLVRYFAFIRLPFTWISLLIESIIGLFVCLLAAEVLLGCVIYFFDTIFYIWFMLELSFTL